MRKIGRHWVPAVIALSVVLLTLSFAACGGSEEAREDVPTATAAGETSAATSPTVDASGGTPESAPPTATPVAEPPSTSSVTLDEYSRNVCGETVTEVGSWEEGDSLRELSEGLGFVSEQMSALEPPTEVAEWHDAQIAFAGVFKETIDDFLEDPAGRTEDEFIVSMFFTVAPAFAPVEQAIGNMAPDVRARMAEAGCIDDDTTGGGRVITEFASISAGGNHTCGVGTDGYVGCWGEDWNGSTQPPDGEFSFVAAGWTHTCGVRADGSVACWGGGDDAEKTMPPGGEFISVSAGVVHTCGVRTDGSVACWGDDDDGEASPPAGQFVSVSAGSNHTCGIRADDSVACWGDGYDGQATPPEGGFVSVSVYGQTCAVRTDGSVACWGDGYDGLPLAVSERPQEGKFISVSVGNTHACGVRTDGSVACWGSDHLGQSSPPEGEFVSVSAGEYHTCGIKADASVACWGSDYDGESSPPVAP